MPTPKNVVKVHPFDKGAKGDVQSADITLNGESIGQIERNWDIVWVGMGRNYVVSDYQVEWDDLTDKNKTFMVEDYKTAVAALSAAKAYIKTVLDEHLKTK